MPRRRSRRGGGPIGDLVGGILPGPFGGIAKVLGNVLGLGRTTRRRRRYPRNKIYGGGAAIKV